MSEIYENFLKANDTYHWSDDYHNGCEFGCEIAEESMQEKLDAKDREIEAVCKKVSVLATNGTCGCSSYDPDDVCVHHSPKVVDLQAKLGAKDKELEALRGFANSLVVKYKAVKENGCNKPLTVLLEAEKFKLIDENGNNTKLLIGDKL
jgi:hypothetical protein